MENQQMNLTSETSLEENVLDTTNANEEQEVSDATNASKEQEVKLTYQPIPVSIIEKKPSEKKGIKGIFSSVWGFIKKHKKLSIFLIILLLIVIWIARSVAAVKDAMAQFTNQTIQTELTKMDLVKSVSVTGSLISADDRIVSTNLGNIEVESVSVKVGDYVQAGQTIITFVSDDLEYELQNSKDQAALNNFKAKHALDTATESVTDANEKYTQDAASTQQDVNAKYAAWVEANKKAKEAKAVYEALLDQKEVLLQNKTNAENAYNTVATEYEAVKDDPSLEPAKKIELDAALAAKDEATSSYNQVAEAEANYLSLQEAASIAYGDYYGRLNDQTAIMKQDAETIEESQYNQTATQMENNLMAKQQSHTIAEVEEKLGKVVVSAPISGVITSINVQEGDLYNGTALFEIQDLNHMVVDSAVEEYDIADVYNDLTAVVKTEATGDTEFHGIVSFVSPIPVTQSVTNAAAGGSSAATYQVKIDLNDGNERLRVGMTAMTSIILAEKKDVFAVAYDAIKEDEKGTYIEVVDEEVTDKNNMDSKDIPANPQMPMEMNTRKIYVTKGMESDYYVEIISNELVEGLQVVSTLETNTMTDIYEMMYEEDGE